MPVDFRSGDAPLKSVLVLDFIVLVDERSVIVVLQLVQLLLLFELLLLVVMMLLLLLVLLLLMVSEGIEDKTRIGIVGIVFRRRRL